MVMNDKVVREGLLRSWPGSMGGYLDGNVELKGGSKEDRLAAREWISLFWHEAVVGESPGHHKS